MAQRTGSRRESRFEFTNSTAHATRTTRTCNFCGREFHLGRHHFEEMQQRCFRCGESFFGRCNGHGC